MRLVPFAFALLAAGLSGCRSHLLEDGPYAFTTTEVLRDDCGAAGTVTLLARGSLTTTGNLVKFAFLSDEPDLQGAYRYVPFLSGEPEQLILDGVISNYRLPLRGQDCLLDTITMHLEAQTVDAARFEGTASLAFQSLGFPDCNCKFWYRFSAARAP